ncbi:hypothetical protein AC41_0582 [Escherichia coli 2-011-08_S3_C3]|nr:hypothetical protein AC41_0582 [Escherichia coli 2-011-08_S3_C3]KDT03555.1 hypothetical protein AB83_0606 [Escherichia coli 2-011-08_S3_C1]KEM78170.1 hypothetical protein AB95_0562 [Escherichia coli 7-233-03_S3_C1]KEN08515.1 hypothetical protein AC53_0544 [Escherichia coli 7-233-03_S3_C3]
MSPWRAAGFPLMVYFLFLSRQEFILIVTGSFKPSGLFPPALQK